MVGFTVAVVAVVADAGARRDEGVHGRVHSHHRYAECLHRRPADLDRRRLHRAQPDRGPAGGAGRSDAGQRFVQRDVRLQRRRSPRRRVDWFRPPIDGGHVADDPTDSACSLTSPNAQLIPVVIPAGTTYARFSLFDADVDAWRGHRPVRLPGHARSVGSSGSGTSAEEVNFTFATPTAAPIALHRRRPGLGRRRVSSPFKLHTWLLGQRRTLAT